MQKVEHNQRTLILPPLSPSLINLPLHSTFYKYIISIYKILLLVYVMLTFMLIFHKKIMTFLIFL